MRFSIGLMTHPFNNGLEEGKCNIYNNWQRSNLTTQENLQTNRKKINNQTDKWKNLQTVLRCS